MSRPFTSHECLPLVCKTILVFEPFTSHEYFLNVSHLLTLPLTRGGILHDAKLVLELYKHCFGKGLGENVSYLFIHRYVLEIHFSLLRHVVDEVVFDLNILRSVMKHCIFQNIDMNLMITMYQSCL